MPRGRKTSSKSSKLDNQKTSYEYVEGLRNRMNDKPDYNAMARTNRATRTPVNAGAGTTMGGIGRSPNRMATPAVNPRPVNNISGTMPTQDNRQGLGQNALEPQQMDVLKRMLTGLK